MIVEASPARPAGVRGVHHGQTVLSHVACAGVPAGQPAETGVDFRPLGPNDRPHRLARSERRTLNAEPDGRTAPPHSSTRELIVA